MSTSHSISTVGHSDQWSEFGVLAGEYNSRPKYPDEMIVDVAQLLAASGTQGPTVVEVGAGTGIFTRLLAAALPAQARIIAIEPSEEMRNVALQSSQSFRSIEYRFGTAEAVDLPRSSVTMVAAASAAHRFDRPCFFKECHRVLAPNGVLAMVSYSHSRSASDPFARDFYDLLERTIPGYSRSAHASGQSNFTTVDLYGEALQSGLFNPIVRSDYKWQVTYDWPSLCSYLDSSTVYRRAASILTEATLRSHMEELFAKHLRPDGSINIEFVGEGNYLRTKS
ncbi:class I SAM-dependent methyltransferase [Sinorhizobium meliloti]|uniref:class I SAM-dependent methyltransferase n=1 Tax=Rhizobium meliloti TaxID=382 RepID=UPI000366ABEE|nr:class I SAM-dependent methyltransferase [Sinorhizobium meliloti]MDE3878757.1 class I SAM-dependent methyltransferase [Sinorhizobium meliloti]MDE4604559.1 class I SAM-dependent methyltransferase [Sinorhizobium meliloti]MDX0315168.1 methyltransferase domain-containing protein [Sinorhizobium meliloti]UDU21120.1 class I SAM-dependent methyltransferase [Sinorhizobium meliloti]